MECLQQNAAVPFGAPDAGLCKPPPRLETGVCIKASAEAAPPAAPGSWTISSGAAAAAAAAAAADRRATACTPAEHAPECMDFVLDPPTVTARPASAPETQGCQAITCSSAVLSLDMELTAEEVQWLVQPHALLHATTVIPPAPIDGGACSRPAPTSRHAVLSRAADSLRVTRRRLTRSVSSGARCLWSVLAAASCISPPRTGTHQGPAGRGRHFTPACDAGWTKTHVNWS